jgi:hypothetical protein
MEPWLIALILRPLGALIFWGGAALFAALLWHFIPASVRPVLYDKNIQKRHPWKFAIFGMIACYGTAALVYWLTK